MIKKIISVLIIIIAIGAIFFISSSKQTPLDTTGREEITTVSPDNLNKSDLSTSLPNISLPKPTLTFPSLNPISEQAWKVFENYLLSARNHKLTDLRIYSHQISDTCNDPTKEAECFALMDNVYALGSGFKKENFENVWLDDKQIILATKYNKMEENSGLPIQGLARSIIFFTRGNNSTLKLLSFRDFDGAFVMKKDLTEDAINKQLLEMVKDSDEDGRVDGAELCLDLQTLEEKANCQTTDPNIRDTDGDGWWDGIEMFFYKQ